MSRRWKYLRWPLCIGAGLAVCAAVVLSERANSPEYGLSRMLCDGCFVAGVVLVGLGALLWISNVGGFSALGYAVYLIKRKRYSSKQKFEERLSYLEYVQVFGEKEKNKPDCMIATGLLFIAAAFAFLCLYWQ